MGKSIFNNQSINYTFDETTWVITVLNTGTRLAGHSVIVIEGQNKNPITNKIENFIGQYDIKFTPYTLQESSFNIKGYISAVDIFENSHSTRDYSRYTAKSYPVDAMKAKEMIRSIKADQVKTEQLIRMIESGSVQEESIDSYFIQNQGFFEYQLMGKSSYLADDGAGDNCAGWVLAKLAVAGIGDGSGKPFPEKIAGGWFCSIQ